MPSFTGQLLPDDLAEPTFSESSLFTLDLSLWTSKTVSSLMWGLWEAPLGNREEDMLRGQMPSWGGTLGCEDEGAGVWGKSQEVGRSGPLRGGRKQREPQEG